MKDPLRLGVVGCGAVAELFHIPAVRQSADFHLTALCDIDERRAVVLAARFGVGKVVQDAQQLVGQVDAAIVAVPHKYHLAVAVPLLRAGIHVLCEKPLALTKDECDQMIAAARQSEAALAAGHYRRFSDNVRHARVVLREIAPPEQLTYSYEEGVPFNWPTHSGYVFDPGEAGGGAMLDTGCHALDLVEFLFGPVNGFDYFDDWAGGIESDVHVRLTHVSGTTGSIAISRTRTLRNTMRVNGPRFAVEWSVWDPIDWHYEGAVPSSRPQVSHPSFRSGISMESLFADQLANFASAIRGQEPLMITAEQAARIVGMIQEMYARRQRLDMPWRWR
jgi:predicted dehydrogenase